MPACSIIVVNCVTDAKLNAGQFTVKLTNKGNLKRYRKC